MARHLLFFLVFICSGIPGRALDSFRSYSCGEGRIGIRILDQTGKELRRVCTQGWRLEPQSGFVNITNKHIPDLLVVVQAGAKASEAMLYRKNADTYVWVGTWSGWNIGPENWHRKTGIHYEMLEPTIKHPKHAVFFLWNGSTFVPISR